MKLLDSFHSEAFNFSDYDEFYNDHFDSQLDELFGGVDSKLESLSEDNDDGDFPDVMDESDDFVPLLDQDFIER